MSKNSFADLMLLAEQNADQAKKKVNASHYSDAATSSDRVVDAKQGKLKQGVAAFLAKREEDDRRRKEEERRKSDKLNYLRNQDRKAVNRVRKMLSMTKSANKSCVDDARDCLDQSVSAQQGEAQPDEDDYGYTSNYAAMMHKKMMDKYKSSPLPPPFPESRVPCPKPLAKNETGGGGRKRKGSSGSSSGVINEEEQVDDPPEWKGYIGKPPKLGHSGNKSEEKPSQKVSKTKPAPPPPVDYEQLLLLASQNQGQPVAMPTKLINDKKKGKGEPEVFEFGRPMTAKEKAKALQEKEMRERLARRFEDKKKSGGGNNNGGGSRGGAQQQSTSFKIPKATQRPGDNDDLGPPKRAKVDSQRKDIQYRRDIPPPQKKGLPSSSEGRQMAGSSSKLQSLLMGEMKNSQRPAAAVPPQSQQRRGGGGPPQRSSQQHEQPPQMKQKLNKGRAIIESDEEQDSDMDDFIDDSDVPTSDISAEIGSIFGYDRRRFQHVDEESDDECMESSVSQQMFEERRTLQIGIKEDLEDMAREEAEKKRARMKMKGQKARKQ